MRGAAALLLGLAALAGCAALRPAASVPECPGALTPSPEIPGSFLLRARMRVESERVQASLELAVQKRDGELTVIAFDPLGARLFALVQRGLDVEVDALPALAVPPRNVLHDLHRAGFRSAELDPPECSYRATLVVLSREPLP